MDNGKVDILNKYDSNAVIGKGENIIKLATHNSSISSSKVNLLVILHKAHLQKNR